MQPMSPTEFGSWFDAHLRLLRLERESERAEFDLLTSDRVKRGQTKLLEQIGLSVGALGVRHTNIGLGGKTIVELERPAQFHTDPKLPYHTFRPGVPAGIIDNELGSTKPSAKNITKEFKVLEGVVSKVTENSISITISAKEDSKQLELPSRCRVVKLADTATFDRLEKTMEVLRYSCESAALCVASPGDATKSGTSSVPLATSVGATVSKARGKKEVVQLTPLMRVLLGIDPIKLNVDEIDNVAVPEGSQNLNESQKHAVKHALSPCPVTLVFGPPGTGKTHTLVSIVSALYARGDRIIIVAASNLAIDNISERLLACKLPLTRLGHPARVLESLSRSTLEHQIHTSDESEIIRDLKKEINLNLAKLSAQGKEKLRGKARGSVYKDVQDLRKDYRQRERGQTQTILKHARIVCATTHGAGSRQLEHEKFDVVIIDESTQAFEAACWIPILRAKSKLILAGDPLQLPPTVKSMKFSSDKSSKTKPTAKSATGAKNALKEIKKATDPSEQEPGVDSTATKDTKSESSESEDGESDLTSKIDQIGSKTKSLSIDKNQKGERNRKSPKTNLSDLMKRPRSLEKTMFDRLLKCHPEICCLLDVQYRMNELIMRFPCDELYGSKLKAADAVKSRLLKDLDNVISEEADGITEPVLLIDTAASYMYERQAEEGEGSIMNENEADLVVKRVETLVKSGVLPEQIMVISPYSAQVSLMNTLLRPQYPTLSIGSIDSCQGRENEVVIISLCRSNSEGVVGFLGEKRRLNVAMTRAKRHLTIIGDSDTLSKGGVFLKNWMEWLENHAEVCMV